MRTSAAVLTWLFFLGVPLPLVQAQDFGTLHQVNGTIQATDKLRVTIHSRFRTDQSASNFFQARIGPILNYQWTPRIMWQAGAYFLKEDENPGTTTRVRPWGGVEIRAVKQPGYFVDWRTLLERHLTLEGPDFTRFRSRATLTRDAKIFRPFGYAEFLVIPAGPFGRYGTGLNWKIGDATLGFGYELRDHPTEPTLHVFTTIVEIPLLRQKP